MLAPSKHRQLRSNGDPSRVSVNGAASVRATGGVREVGAIYNISVGGCAISAPGFYAVGSRVHVRIDNFQPFSGEVIWHQDGCIGIQFEVPLHPAVVEHIGLSKLR